MSFQHHAEKYSRTEKVSRISTWTVMHSHLRVCWEQKAPRLNCGICAKCVWTQLELLVAGGLDLVQVFPEGHLHERIDEVRCVEPHHTEMYQELSRRIDDPVVGQALRRLLERSLEDEPRPAWPRCWSRGLRRLTSAETGKRPG